MSFTANPVDQYEVATVQPRAAWHPRFAGDLPYPIDRNLDNLKINDHFLTEQLRLAITDGSLTETMEGAATLELTVHDATYELLHGGLLKQWMGINPPIYTYRNGKRRKVKIPDQWADVRCKLDKRDFALANVTKSGRDFTLTFENRAVHELRRYDKRRTWYRDLFTRAQVIKATVQEVKGYHIDFFCPELKKVQPIAAATDLQPATETQNATKKGFDRDVHITVKHVRASAQQISIIQRVLATGVSMGSSYKVLVASIMTITQESDVSLLDSPSGYGPFSQLRNGAWPASVTDVERDAAAFFKEAIRIDKQNPTISTGALCQAVQRSAYPHAYDQWENEAKQTLRAYGTTDASSSITYQEYNRYAFTRGGDSNNEDEDSWTFDLRLADEVGWRLFMVNNTLWYVEDNWLLTRKPIDSISEEEDAIDAIDYDIDTNKTIQTATVTCHADRWQVPPGAVIKVEDMGPANGKWLVHEIQYPLFSHVCEVTLQVPAAPKPEPAPSTRDVTMSGFAPPNATGGSAVGAASHQQASTAVPGHPELKPAVAKLVNIILAHFPKLLITSTTRGGENPNTCSHTAGRACDLSCGDQAYMDRAGGWIDDNLRPYICQGIHNPVSGTILSVNAGQIVSVTFWGSDWAKHRNHIHIAA